MLARISEYKGHGPREAEVLRKNLADSEGYDQKSRRDSTPGFPQNAVLIHLAKLGTPSFLIVSSF